MIAYTLYISVIFLPISRGLIAITSLHCGFSFAGYEWVGWRNDTGGFPGRPVELIFEFDRVRNFSSMYLHTNNLHTKDVQVFSHAKVYFSIGGRQFNGEPVFFSYMPDLIMEAARNVTIKMHNRVGRFVKLQLYFASRWIMISEVSFDSGELTSINLAPSQPCHPYRSILVHA
ncbi:hypothetical protein J437_LFUL000891 [Ladona fulva]|uniref:Discoidin domain-containing protein n=1 Tax=Ladona fulva TaxID=123851 RepID=A0A8K0KA96_LADFU|nr:hypothetical protein J437_LFUL000891 [Ladona fulva]